MPKYSTPFLVDFGSVAARLGWSVDFEGPPLHSTIRMNGNFCKTNGTQSSNLGVPTRKSRSAVELVDTALKLNKPN